MNLTDFFEDEHDLAESLKTARDHLMPIMEMADVEADPGRKVKLQTAVFIIMTFNAVKVHGLTKNNARRIVSNLIDTINDGGFDEVHH
jgi:hypothetical protein